MLRTLLLTGLLIAAGALRAEADALPDEAKVRAKVNDAIASAEKSGKPATLGLLHDVLTLSISFGAPAYNLGDVEGCHRFYRQSMKDLLTAFGAEGKATPTAAKQLKIFAECLARSEKLQTDDDKAWALRFGWDRAALEWDLSYARAAQLARMSTLSLFRGRSDEAESACREAVEAYPELRGYEPASVPLVVASAGMTLTRILVARGKFEEAAKILKENAAAVPEWPTYAVDENVYFKDGELFAAALKKLEEATAKAPENADLHRLLAHEYYFSQNLAQAQAEFQKVLELAPGDATAKAYRRMAADSPEQKQIAEWIKEMGSEDFDKRAAASTKIKEQGRWAISALHKELERTKDPEIRTRCLELLKPLGGAEPEGEND